MRRMLDRYGTCDNCGKPIGYAPWLSRWVHVTERRVECVWEATLKHEETP